MALLDPKAAQSVKQMLDKVRGIWSRILSFAALIVATVSMFRAFDIMAGVPYLPRLGLADAAYGCVAVAAAVWVARNS